MITSGCTSALTGMLPAASPSIAGSGSLAGRPPSGSAPKGARRSVSNERSVSPMIVNEGMEGVELGAWGAPTDQTFFPLPSVDKGDEQDNEEWRMREIRSPKKVRYPDSDVPELGDTCTHLTAVTG